MQTQTFLYRIITAMGLFSEVMRGRGRNYRFYFSEKITDSKLENTSLHDIFEPTWAIPFRGLNSSHRHSRRSCARGWVGGGGGQGFTFKLLRLVTKPLRKQLSLLEKRKSLRKGWKGWIWLEGLI